MQNNNSPNTPRKILISAFLIGIISFTLGFYFSSKNGLGIKELFNTVTYNVRKFNFGPLLTEFKNADAHTKMDIKDIRKIIIKSSFSNIDVQSVQGDDIEIDVTGTIKSEIEKETLNTHKEGNLLFIDIANKKIANPTSEGLFAKLKIGENFKGIIEVSSDSGRINFGNMNQSNLMIWTVSGDVNFQGLRNNTIFVSSISGSCYINSNNIHADLNLNTGNIKIQSSTVKGTCTTVSGNIEIKAEGITGTTQLSTESGDIKFSAPLGYRYELKSEKGNTTLGNQSLNVPTKGQFNNGVNLLWVFSSSGKIILE